MASSFVKKLFAMVENENDDIICWVSNGAAFEVLSPKRLEAEILPKFFRHSRFQSMVRQLNFYAFKKVTKERSSWVYSHDFFIAGRPDLLERVKRKTNGLAFEFKGGSNETPPKLRLCDNDVENVSSPGKRSYTSVSSDISSSPSDDERWESPKYGNFSPLKLPPSSSENPSEMFSSNCMNLTPRFSTQKFRSEDETGSRPPCPSRKKFRRSYSTGCIDETQSNADVNYEKILSKWSNVHNFFIDKDRVMDAEKEADRSEDFSPTFSSLSDYSSDEGKNDNLIEEEEESSSSLPECKGDTSSGELSELLKFCIETDPWQSSCQLSAGIHSLLSRNQFLTKEMDSYSNALTLSSQTLVKAIVKDDEAECVMGSRSPRFVIVRKWANFPPQFQAEKEYKQFVFNTQKVGEVSTVRTFLSFALATLHNAAFAEKEKAKQVALRNCAEKWGEYAQSCL